MQRTMPELPGAAYRRVPVRGIELNVAEAGDPAAPPVLLVHGWPQHSYAWRKLLPGLAEDYRVVAPDLRGFGWSDAPAEGYEKRELALDMLELIERLELGPVRFAGHDWGGMVGYLACFERPELISHLLAIGISHPWPRRGSSPLQALKGVARLAYMVPIASPILGREVLRRTAMTRLALLKGAAQPGAAWAEGELDTFVDQWCEPARAAAGSAIYRTFITRELPALMRGGFREQRIEVPTVLLCGERDPVIRPEDLGGYERNAPRMRIEVLPEVGHWVPEEAPEATLAAARDLFSS